MIVPFYVQERKKGGRHDDPENPNPAFLLDELDPPV